MVSPVIEAIKQALENDSENLTLRYHLIELLIQNQVWQEALEQASQILAQRPDDLQALAFAAQAAAACGMSQQATAYQRMCDLLQGSAIEPTTSKPANEDQAPAINTETDRPTPSPPRGPFASPPGAPSQRNDDPRAQDTTPDKVDPTDGHPLDHSQAPDHAESAHVVRLKAVKGGMADDIWQEDEPIITLADVAGMEEVKQRLELSLLGPLKNPDLMKLYGKSLRGGLLLYGPPGCGKTYMARAIAGELGARFISIGLADVMDMYLGQSEQNLHQIFENARRNAPSVVFLDEIDALGRKRSLRRESASRDIVNQLLTELDNVKGGNKSLYVLAATNHPWDVDTALRRPGRLDRTLLVLPPDRVARHFLLEREFKDRPTEKLDLEMLANKTENFSGADLVHLCESAAEIAIADSVKRNQVRPILQKDCKQALKEIRPSTRTWFETARNYALFANEGGAYDDLLVYMRDRRIL